MKTFLLWVIGLALVGNMMLMIRRLETPSRPAPPKPTHLTWVWDERGEVILEGDLTPAGAGFNLRNCVVVEHFPFRWKWHCYPNSGRVEEVK